MFWTLSFHKYLMPSWIIFELMWPTEMSVDEIWLKDFILSKVKKDSSASEMAINICNVYTNIKP